LYIPATLCSIKPTVNFPHLLHPPLPVFLRHSCKSQDNMSACLWCNLLLYGSMAMVCSFPLSVLYLDIVDGAHSCPLCFHRKECQHLSKPQHPQHPSTSSTTQHLTACQVIWSSCRVAKEFWFVAPGSRVFVLVGQQTRSWRLYTSNLQQVSLLVT